MNFKSLKKSLIRIISLLLSILSALFIIYLIIPARQNFENSIYDKQENAIWLSHGFLGDDTWFRQNRRNIEDFRDPQKIDDLFAKLKANHIKFVFPHLCPAQFNGEIAKYDSKQIVLVTNIAAKYDIQVIPWVGGVLDESAKINSHIWRKNFVASIQKLLKIAPNLAGVQINIEPLPSYNKNFLLLLDDLNSAIPDKIISVAAYPPPTFWHPFPNVHWELPYLKEVARRSDQLAVMMYDTAIKLDKFYIILMRQWSNELNKVVSTTNCKLLLGVPAYEDKTANYHYSYVENLENALAGIQGSKIDKNYQGIAIYCEWEMDNDKWNIWQRFLAKTSNQ